MCLTIKNIKFKLGYEIKIFIKFFDSLYNLNYRKQKNNIMSSNFFNNKKI